MAKDYMKVKDFVEAAGMPDKWQESNLQEYIAQRLYELGNKEIYLEFKCRGGRADIVTPSTIYEVKKWLTRDHLYQAMGQVACYQKNIKGNKKGVIIGFKPTKDDEKKSAETTAAYIEQSSNIKVVFVNCDREWFPKRGSSKKWLESLKDGELVLRLPVPKLLKLPVRLLLGDGQLLGNGQPPRSVREKLNSPVTLTLVAITLIFVSFGLSYFHASSYSTTESELAE